MTTPHTTAIPDDRSDWLRQFHVGLGVLFNKRCQLLALADSFRATGNFHMAETLTDIADQIHEAHEDIQGAISRDLSDRCRESSQMIGDVFLAALNATGERQ